MDDNFLHIVIHQLSEWVVACAPQSAQVYGVVRSLSVFSRNTIDYFLPRFKARTIHLRDVSEKGTDRRGSNYVDTYQVFPNGMRNGILTRKHTYSTTRRMERLYLDGAVLYQISGLPDNRAGSYVKGNFKLSWNPFPYGPLMELRGGDVTIRYVKGRFGLSIIHNKAKIVETPTAHGYELRIQDGLWKVLFSYRTSCIYSLKSDPWFISKIDRLINYGKSRNHDDFDDIVCKIGSNKQWTVVLKSHSYK